MGYTLSTKEARALAAELGGVISDDKGVRVLTGRASLALGLLEKYGAKGAGGISDLTFENEYNLGSMKKFKGLLTEGLAVPELNKKTKAELAAGPLGTKLRSLLSAFTPKRKRRKDEYDGDFNMDRRWEADPYDFTYREMVQGARAITIDADMSLSWGTSEETINKYGAVLWAVCELVEEAGISVELLITNRSTGLSTTKRDARFRTEFKAKAHGEYLTPSALAAMCSVEMYRRATFATLEFQPKLYGENAASSLGSPDYSDSLGTSVAFDAGVIKTTCKLINMNATDVAEAFTGAIAAAIGGGE